MLRVQPDLHRTLKSAALRAHVSLNHFCESVLQNSISPTIQRNPELSGLSRAISLEYSDREMEGIVLFGSAARGELTESSDIDLLIVTNLSVERELYKRWDLSKPIQKEITQERHPVNPQFVQMPKSLDQCGSLWLEAATEGRILLDPRGEIHRRFVEIRKAVLEGQFARAMSHGHPYWIRKRAQS